MALNASNYSTAKIPNFQSPSYTNHSKNNFNYIITWYCRLKQLEILTKTLGKEIIEGQKLFDPTNSNSINNGNSEEEGKLYP